MNAKISPALVHALGDVEHQKFWRKRVVRDLKYIYKSYKMGESHLSCHLVEIHPICTFMI